jgi:Mn-containing catalase
LQLVQSEIKGGEGLDTEPYTPQPGTETTSPVDSTPVGEYTNGVGTKKGKSHDKHAAKLHKDAKVAV